MMHVVDKCDKHWQQLNRTSSFFKPSLAFFSLSTTFFPFAAACKLPAVLTLVELTMWTWNRQQSEVHWLQIDVTGVTVDAIQALHDARQVNPACNDEMQP